MPNVFTLESTFSGMDYGKHKGFHMTTLMLESVGRDLARCLLIYNEIFVPPELRDTFKMKPKVKKFNEDSAGDYKALIL